MWYDNLIGLSTTLLQKHILQTIYISVSFFLSLFYCKFESAGGILLCCDDYDQIDTNVEIVNLRQL